MLHKLNKNHHNKPKDNKDDLQKTILLLLPFFLKNFKENNI